MACLTRSSSLVLALEGPGLRLMAANSSVSPVRCLLTIQIFMTYSFLCIQPGLGSVGGHWLIPGVMEVGPGDGAICFGGYGADPALVKQPDEPVYPDHKV